MTRVVWISLILFGWIGSPAAAQVLENRGAETTLTVSYEEGDDLGSVLTLEGSVLLILAKGYLEVGPVFSYSRIDLDGIPTIKGSGAGPRLEFNLLPSESATPFVTGSILFLGGDLGDLFDREDSYGAGFKAFSGNSAAFRIAINRIKRLGKTGLEDQESTLITAGLSLFFGGQ